MKAIIWDLGNVVYSFDQSITDKKLSERCSKTPEEIRNILFGGYYKNNRRTYL